MKLKRTHIFETICYLCLHCDSDLGNNATDGISRPFSGVFQQVLKGRSAFLTVIFLTQFLTLKCFNTKMF